jgi:hypothetical protein
MSLVPGFGSEHAPVSTSAGELHLACAERGKS